MVGVGQCAGLKVRNVAGVGQCGSCGLVAIGAAVLLGNCRFLDALLWWSQGGYGLRLVAPCYQGMQDS